MKQELYHYATSLKNKGLSNIPTICLIILLTIFLVPVIMSNIILGILLSFSYIFLSFLRKRESDEYNKDLQKFGMFLLFLGIEFSSLMLMQYNLVIPFVVVLMVTLISYEILFLVKLQRKAYSRGNRKKNAWIYITTPVCGWIGIRVGRFIAQSEAVDLKLQIMILLCSLLITYSCTFLQKYFIHKIIG